MFVEYAVDPDLAMDLNALQVLGDRFGWEKGRLIAEYPVRWKALAFEAIEASNAQPVKKQSQKVRLKKLFQHLIRRSATNWSPDNAWLGQALAEHERHPFRAIVTAVEDATQGQTIPWDTDNPDVGLWAVPGGVIPRSPDQIAEALVLLAAGASRLLLVDPHFDPSAARFTSTLEAILVGLKRPPARGRVPMVELHTTLGNSNGGDQAKRYLANCGQLLPRVVPTDVALAVTVWSGRDGGHCFHNRYVLTERGGIALGTGLDAGREGSGETDDLHRLTSEQHKRRWADLTADSSPYDLVSGPVPIRGSAPPLYSLV